jgi:membrane fusion protein, heavy metal efflux system
MKRVSFQVAAFASCIGVIGCRREVVPAPVKTASFEMGVVHLSDEAQKSAGILVQSLVPKAFSPKLKLSATLVGDPSRIAHVGARVPGRVSAIRVKLGEVVRKGQPLLDIESVDIHEATLMYLTAQARMSSAKDALERQKLLFKERVGAESELRRAESDFAAARAAVDEGEEHLQFLGLGKADLRALENHTPSAEHPGTLRSPIAGRVTALNVSIGQVVSGSEDALTVADTKQLWASMRVYERDLAFVSVGRAVELELPGVPGRRYKAAVSFVSDLVDPMTRTAEAQALLETTSDVLRPGSTATAFVSLPVDANALWLPDEAMQVIEGQPSVFVAQSGGRFAVQALKASASRGGYFQVESGVAAGTLIVVKGAFSLRGELERANISGEE